MNSQLIWQPKYLSVLGDFQIELNPIFAKSMFDIKLSQKLQRRINESSQNLRDALRLTTKEPYQFSNNTALIEQIDPMGGQGLWLALDGKYNQLPNFSESLTYITHNVSKNSDTIAILSLFDHWIKNADIYGELNKC